MQAIPSTITTTKDPYSSTLQILPPPYITNLQEEYEKIRQKLIKNSSYGFEMLTPKQQFCCILIEKYNLNTEQTAAFLIYAEHIISNSTTPLRLLITGPGGSGKSQIFTCVKEFHKQFREYKSLKICAPTGLAANNIGGSTIHSEASLRVKKTSLHAKTPKADNLHHNLEERFKNTATLICDEIYFLGAVDNAKLSGNLNIARDSTDTNTIYGNFNIIFAGDPAQLSPPGATSLYSQKALNLYENMNFNILNTQDKDIAEGILSWRQIDLNITLKEIMRQSEADFKNLLNRLRFGNCTTDDYKFLQQFIIQNRSTEINTKLLGINNWIYDRANASPLICYTNILRDVHNYNMSKTFAQQTNQEYTYYHSYDTMQGTKTKLTNTLAETAWRIPIKTASDLAGRLPLIPGMPVFLTDNLATELGLSNGSEGTLINVHYYISGGRRYAIYAEVDFPTYINPLNEYPNRVTIIPTTESVEVAFGHEKNSYKINRLQLPLLPGFAYTAHNSQGRSLNRACIDLASCPNTAAAYVMLSRIRSLDGISILRPFSQQKISSHIPQEVRNEIRRLDALHNKTISYLKTNIKWYYTDT